MFLAKKLGKISSMGLVAREAFSLDERLVLGPAGFGQSGMTEQAIVSNNPSGLGLAASFKMMDGVTIKAFSLAERAVQTESPQLLFMI